MSPVYYKLYDLILASIGSTVNLSTNQEQQIKSINRSSYKKGEIVTAYPSSIYFNLLFVVCEGC